MKKGVQRLGGGRPAEFPSILERGKTVLGLQVAKSAHKSSVEALLQGLSRSPFHILDALAKVDYKEDAALMERVADEASQFLGREDEVGEKAYELMRALYYDARTALGSIEAQGAVERIGLEPKAKALRALAERIERLLAESGLA
ncbi:MAG: hypothetical protein QXH27_00865 [Candidatus Micrarchaeia archaeon]